MLLEKQQRSTEESIASMLISSRFNAVDNIPLNLVFHLRLGRRRWWCCLRVVLFIASHDDDILI